MSRPMNTDWDRHLDWHQVTGNFKNTCTFCHDLHKNDGAPRLPHWTHEIEYESREYKAKTGWAILRKDGRYYGKIVAVAAAQIVTALNQYELAQASELTKQYIRDHLPIPLPPEDMEAWWNRFITQNDLPIFTEPQAMIPLYHAFMFAQWFKAVKP